MEEFVDRQSQYREVDLRDSLKIPVVRVSFDLSVDSFDMIDCAVDKFFGEGVVVALLILRFDKDTQGITQLLGLIELPLIEKLHGSHAVFAALCAALDWF